MSHSEIPDQPRLVFGRWSPLRQTLLRCVDNSFGGDAELLEQGLVGRGGAEVLQADAAAQLYPRTCTRASHARLRPRRVP